MTTSIHQKLKIFEELQQKELKIYEKFLITLEKQVSQLIHKINQPDLLNQMMEEKRKMMSSITEIETELSPLRKELGIISSEKIIDLVGQAMVNRLKTIDLTIIDLISKISRSEQELMHRINEQMDVIKKEIKKLGHERLIQSTYQNTIDKSKTIPAPETGTRSSFNLYS